MPAPSASSVSVLLSKARSRPVDGQRYAIRPGSTLQRGAGGTAADWSYGTQGALSFLIELRPTSGSEGGFVLPPEQIVPTCEDSLAAVLELADWVISHR
ncbi:MAG TPA: M14 family zinc carboxypeptidase [Kofleriaceae bacterium]|nr:M14 family zinc carboxypeptidase [Kofleriaceae bacterium]